MEFQTSQFYEYLDYPAKRKERINKLLNLLKEKGITLDSFIAKGYRGVVFKGMYRGKPVAVKVLRSDVEKENPLQKECEILNYLTNKLKSENPAPYPYLCTSEFIAMEFIEGLTFSKALENYDPYTVLKEALRSCYLLDKAGVRHSEIKGEKHLIFDGRRFRIIDFESAKFSDKPRNLLQFVGYHLIRNKELLKKLGICKKDLRLAIEIYKENKKDGFWLLNNFFP